MAGLTELLERARFDDVLWNVAASARPHELPAERSIAAAIAAQHLGLWREAAGYARRWADGGAHLDEGPLVSLIVPTRNRRESLRRALQSVAAQLYRPIEVIVVNDAGESVTDVVEEFAESLSVRQLVQPRNRQLAAARNAGLLEAQGYYVGYLDDDDQLYPHHVGHLVSLLQAQGARAAHAIPYMQRRPPDGAAGERLERYPLRPFHMFELLIENVVPVQAMLHERSLIKEIGRFDESLRANEDWEFWIRLRRVAAVEQSPLITSCVDCRDDAARISASVTPFLHGHSVIYDRYRELAGRVGGRELRERQRRRLGELVRQAEGEVRGRSGVSIVVHGARKSDVAQAAAEIGGDVPVEPLALAGPRALRRGLERMVRDRPEDDIVLLNESCVDAVTSGWLVRLAAHLAADRRLAAVGALDLGRIDAEELAELLGAPADASAERNARRLREGRVLLGRTVPEVRPDCLLLRGSALADGLAALGDEDGDDRELFPALHRVWTAAGWEVRRADDVCLLPPYEEPPLVAAALGPAGESEAPVDEPPLIVLGYHRVLQEVGEDPFGLAVSREHFAAQLDLLSERFRIVAPAELFDGSGSAADPRPRLLLTFDDGYRDNYAVAYPLLWQRGIPAVLFVASGFIDSGRPFWWEALQRSERFRRLDPRQREALQEEWRYLSPTERDARLQELALDEPARSAAAALSADWRMLEEMAADGLIELGAHTRGHPSLGRLEAAELEEQIGGSIADIESHVGRRPRLFAYPHGSAGDVSEAAIDELQRRQVAFAFTTMPGVIDAATLHHPGSREALTLPRCMAANVTAGELAAGLEQRLVGTAPSRSLAAAGCRRSIVVLSGITANNLGDDAMLIAVVRDLRRLDPHAEICVLAEDPARCRNVQQQIDVPILHSPQLLIQRYLGRIDPADDPALAVADLARALLEKQASLAAGQPVDEIPPEFLEGLRRLTSADGVVDCGGANLSPHWKSYFYEKCVDYLLAARPLLVSGQGIDRFDDEHDRQLLLAALSQATEITLREPVSESYLRELGCSVDFRCTGDDALTLEPSGRVRQASLLERAGLAPDQPYLAFQFRHYLDYEDPAFLQRFAGYVDAAIRATGLPVVGVPMHFDRTDEREHLLELRRHVASAGRFHVVETHLTPGDAMGLIASARTAFGISYHSAVFALGSGTPYLGLYRGAHYTQKMQGLEAIFAEPGVAVPVDATGPGAFGRLVAQRLAQRDEIRGRLLARGAALRAEVVDSRRRFLDQVRPSSDVASMKRPEQATKIDWGGLRRLEPISRQWGFDRGRPVDRFYIERFLERHRERVRGDVCELLDDVYARRFGGDRLSRVDVLDIDPDNPRATLVDDLTAPRRLPAGAFDCFILTQTLPYIFDCGAALQHAYAALKPGGSLLVTVPSIIKYHREPEDHWRFTPDSLERLIRESCPGAEYRVEAHGNLVAAVGFLHGMAVEDLHEDELLAEDPEYPLVVTAVVERSASGGSMGNAA